MFQRVAMILDAFSLKNLCFLYFFAAPIFLERRNEAATFFVFGLGYLLSGLIVFLACTERITSFSETIRFRRLSLVFLGMVGICLFSILINTPEKLVSPAGYFFKYAKLILPMICFFVMINIWTLKDVPKLYALITGMGVVSLVTVVFEVIFIREDRLGMLLFDDPNRYALFLNVLYAMLLPKLLGRFLEGKVVFPLLMGLCLIVGVLFLTLSRSGMVTFVVITGLGIWSARSRKLRIYALIALVPVGLVFLGAVLLRYAGASSPVASDLGRIWTYLVAWNVIQDRPFTGIGFANIVSVYDQYGGIYLILLGRALGVHNTTLEIFAETGFFGMVIYLLMVFVPVILLLKRIVRISRQKFPVLDVAAVGVPLAFFCYGLFIPNYLADDYFWVYMTFTIVILRGGSRNSPLPELSAES